MHIMPIGNDLAGGSSRRGRKKQRTRKAILEAARELARHAPVATLSVEAISEAADIARATFFLHFPSKASLLVALEEALLAEFMDAVDSTPGRSPERLRAGLERVFGWGASAGDVLHASLALRGHPDGPLLEALGAFVRDGQKRGDLRRDLSPERMARALAGAVGGMLADGRAEESGGGPTRCEDVLGVLLRGMGEPKPRLKWSAGR